MNFNLSYNLKESLGVNQEEKEVIAVTEILRLNSLKEINQLVISCIIDVSSIKIF